MRDLAALSSSDFEPHVGSMFSLAGAGPDGPHELKLLEAAVIGNAPATPSATEITRQPFALVFQGPASPILDQRIHRLEREGLGAIEVFLVPLGPAEGGARYEAVFN